MIKVIDLTQPLYIKLGNPKSLQEIPLAFTIPDHIKPVTVNGFTLSWTQEALATFNQILQKSHSKVKNLPYAALRGHLQVALNQWMTRLQSSVGLNKYELKQRPQPFAYLMDGNLDEIQNKLRSVLNDWLFHFLKPFAEREKILSATIEYLEDLQDEKNLIQISPVYSKILPWEWSSETGTTQHKSSYDYQILVDYIASQIAEQEIFKGLGPIRRIISSSGNFQTGVAELITNPINLEKYNIKGQFSLVVRLEIVTFPSLHQPLLKIDVSKRRWLSQLKSSSFDRQDISGYAFSSEFPNTAFSFKVTRKKDDNKKWNWIADKGFEVLQRELKLPVQVVKGQEIALGQASTPQCQVFLTFRNGLQDKLESYQINAGVPEIDKLEAWGKIAKILEPNGFIPFDNYEKVKARYSGEQDLSRMVNCPSLLSAILETLETNVSGDFTPKYLDKVNDSQLNGLLTKHFKIGLNNINQGRKDFNFGTEKDQINELPDILAKNQQALQRLYPNEKPLLIIFYQSDLQLEKILLETVVKSLCGDSVELLMNRLPENTHGPKDSLPDSHLKAKERSKTRIEAWEPLAQQLKQRHQRTFCLVVAREFYSDSTNSNDVKHDDQINKPSTRQALSSLAGACIQFLRPIETNKANQYKLDDFFHRVQSSLKDLLFAHSGRIDDVQEKVNKCLKDIPSEARPQEIIGITIVRKQKGHVRGRIENTFLPVALRLNVETGNCEMCCAYEDANTNRLEISPWSKFADAITFVSELSPIKLADKDKARKIRFQKFVKTIISESVEKGAQPLVMIDSTNCVQLWPWLADAQMNTNQIDLGEQYEHMEQEWKGARLIRIRQEISPGILDKKERQFAETSLEDTRKKNELRPTYTMPSASSVFKLYRLNSTNPTGCVAYLSVGRKTFQKQYRGQSCYHPIQSSEPVKENNTSKDKVSNQAGLEVHQLSQRPPFAGQWATPNPLEIVVTLRQEDDDPDALAALVESLRYSFGHYSDWGALPGPLFFERVVRDYISAFSLSDEDTEPEEDS